MIFYKKIEIDLEAERRRIKKCDFTPAERKKLLKLVDLVEAGDLSGGVELSGKWSQEMREYIGDHWNLLWETDIGYEFYTAEQIPRMKKENDVQN